MWGTLSTGVYTVPSVTDVSTYYVFPKDGNTFIFAEDASYNSLTRLNHQGTDRFPRGTVITLLFLQAGISIGDGVYINIISTFSSTAHCSLTLLALDAGTWVEVGRSV